MLAFDRVSGRAAASEFIRARKAEEGYARHLRRLARNVGRLIRDLWDPDDPASVDAIDRALDAYARAADPWARAVARRMIAEVAARDRKAWMETAKTMGRLLRAEIDTAPTGQVMQARLGEQVKLITSIPIEAAERVRHLTTEALTGGRRPAEIATEIMRSGEVAASRATLIAQTEIGRTSTELTRARAEHVGSEEFIWRTMGDEQVRASHRRLNGRVFRWDGPPECDPGHHALPGAIWNCRCYAEPVIP